MAATLNDKLELIRQARNDIKVALNNKGQSVSEDIRDYAEAINSINSGEDSNIKLFSTIDEMQSDPTAKEGDLAVVYGSSIQNGTATTEFTQINFPDTVVLPSAVTSSYYCMMRSGTGMGDGQVMLNSNEFRFDFSGGFDRIRIAYTSSDGITYTKTEGDSIVEFENPIKCYYEEEWNDNFGYFMQTGGYDFEGLYQYKTNSIYTEITLMSMEGINLEVTSNSITDITYQGHLVEIVSAYTIYNMINKIKEYMSIADNAIKNKSFTLIMDTNRKLKLIATTMEYDDDFSAIIFDENNTYLGICIGNIGNLIKPHKIFSFNTDYTQIESVEDITILPTSEGSSVKYYNVDTITIPIKFKIKENVNYATTGLQFSIGYVYGNGNVTSIFTNKIHVYNDGYILTPNQFTLTNTNDLISGKAGYGKTGIITGTLGDNPSYSFADENAQIYATIQNKYDNMEPRVLTDGDKTIDKNIFFIPVNKNGEPLLNTSNVTDMYDMFHNCTNLTTMPLLDTSNVTDMGHMFYGCTNLIEIPLLDTSNVTYMNGMFYGCTNLIEIPLLDTSNVTYMNGMFNGCTNLSNDSLNNILAMCKNATKITSNKTLKYIGLTSEQAAKCTTLSNYSAFTRAGWTTGY